MRRIFRMCGGMISRIDRTLRQRGRIRMMLRVMLGALIVGTGFLVRNDSREFIAQATSSANEFKEPYTSLTISPQDILYGDTFYLTITVTLDSRRVDPGSVRIVWLNDNVNVRNVASRTQESGGFTVVIEQVFTLQCFLCVPERSPHEIKSADVLFMERDGRLRKLSLPQPQLRVHTRLVPGEQMHPFLYLRPSHPTLTPWHAPDQLKMLFLGMGMVTWIGGAVLITRALWSRKRAVRDAGDRANRYRKYRYALEGLEQKLLVFQESHEVLREAYAVFAEARQDPFLEFSEAYGRGLDERFSRAVFGEPSTLDMTAASALLNDFGQALRDAEGGRGA